MGKARIEFWNRANTTKLSDAFTLDGDLQQRNIDDLDPTGRKLNESGGGGLALQADHPAHLAGHTAPGNCVRLHSDATRVHTFRIRERDTARIRRKQVDRTVTLDGDDLLDDWEHSVVQPWIPGPPISPDRVWNFAAPTLDRSSWLTTNFVHLREDVAQRWPKAFPNAPIYAGWVSTRAESPSHPVGDWIAHRQFTLAAPATVVFFLAADDAADPWIDGVELDRNAIKAGDTSGWEDTWRWAPPLSAGTHHYTVKVTNNGGPSALVSSAFTVVGGVIAAPLLSTNDLLWEFLDYPDPKPGFTAPQILSELLTEAQARGELGGWSIVVHGTHAQLPEFSCRIGTTYREVIDSLVALAVDVEADTAGLVLHVWPKGGQAGPVVVSLGDDSIVELNEVDDDDFYNAALGVWSNGATWRTDPASIAVRGRRSTSEQLGSVTDLSAVHTILDRHIALRTKPTRTLVGKFVDVAGKVAGVNYRVGDAVEVDGVDSVCSGITWTVARNGDLIPHPEFDSLDAVRRRELERAIERMVAQFDSPASASLLTDERLIIAGRPSTEEHNWSWADDIEEALNEIDPDKPWQIKEPEKTQRIYRFAIQIDPADLPDAFGVTKVRLLKNGAVINPLYDLTLNTVTHRMETLIWGYEVVRKGDRLQVQCLESGGHVDGSITLGLADPV